MLLQALHVVFFKLAPTKVQGIVFLRSNFGSSRLVRLLGEWNPVEGEAPGADFAEQLSLWLNAFDAIGLQAAHQSIRAIRTAAPVKPRDTRGPRVQTLEEDVQRVRAALSGAIARELSLDAGDASYSPYRQRHLELQRQMEMMIGPLRQHVREALGRVSPGLRQLAALDAVFEQWLAPREQMLLPKAADLMAQRFKQLQRAQRTECEAGEWLEAFGKDWRDALLAELELRLEPVVGLVEALNNELKNRA